MELIDVFDGAFIHDLSLVPKNVPAIIGYVGGAGAYHIWPFSDAERVRASNRQFWGIWVPPQGRPLKAQDGIDSARGMIAALQKYNYAKSCPVFFDIEFDQYDMDKQGASLAASTFQATMKSSGYLRPYPYAPLEMQRGWVSHYVDNKPTELPAGTVGWQYKSGPNWDSSIFDAELLGEPTAPGWNVVDMEFAVIIRRLDNGKVYRCNVLDGTCNHLLNNDAVDACIRDLKKANVPYTRDEQNSIAGYVEV